MGRTADHSTTPVLHHSKRRLTMVENPRLEESESLSCRRRPASSPFSLHTYPWMPAGPGMTRGVDCRVDKFKNPRIGAEGCSVLPFRYRAR